MNRYAVQTADIGCSIEPRLAVGDEEGSEVSLLIDGGLWRGWVAGK
jgi:hypothetical protein